ncbi:MAG: hypothetical protein PHY48_17005, partial [Candidatus Cloacimonetes bacterium]|nr:hypothetical protein [Candidatus Cloacimonadota bacterium]
MRKAFLATAMCLLLSAAFGLSSNIATASVAETRNAPVAQLELTVSEQMLLSWTAITNATGYTIYHAIVPEPVDSE